jgi:molybdopterin-guanine dinucleotide biosynthesis protein A
MFLPVDVPLVPPFLLRRWAEAVLAKAEAGCAASFLLVNGGRQPAFCMVRRSALAPISEALDQGERRLAALLCSIETEGQRRLWTPEALDFAPEAQDPTQTIEHWFSNVNTPDELAQAEAWAWTSERPE